LADEGKCPKEEKGNGKEKHTFRIRMGIETTALAGAQVWCYDGGKSLAPLAPMVVLYLIVKLRIDDSPIIYFQSAKLERSKGRRLWELGPCWQRANPGSSAEDPKARTPPGVSTIIPTEMCTNWHHGFLDQQYKQEMFPERKKNWCRISIKHRKITQGLENYTWLKGEKHIWLKDPDE